MENVKFIVKKPNNEVRKLINDEEALKVLFETGLPDTEYMDFRFDGELKINGNHIIVGDFNGNDLFIDLENNGAIYAMGTNNPLFFNSSLFQFSQYIVLLADFINKKIKDPSGKSKYIYELGKKMIEVDIDAYNDKQYYWGSIIEEYENSVLL